MDDGWLGKEGRDVKKGMFLLSQGEGTDTWKTSQLRVVDMMTMEKMGRAGEGKVW